MLIATGGGTTTIDLTKGMKKTLEGMKVHRRETYEDVLERLLNDLSGLSDHSKKEINQTIREIREGKFRTNAQLKAEMAFQIIWSD